MAAGRRLEYEVQDNMATNPHCAGITVVRGWYSEYDSGTGDVYQAAVAKDRWDLLLGLQPGSTKYDCTLVRWSHGDHDRTLGGEGSTDRSRCMRRRHRAGGAHPMRKLAHSLMGCG
jgi:hypothetical protein